MKFFTTNIKPIFLVLTLIVTALIAASGTEAQVESRGGEHRAVYPSWDGVWSTSYGRMELAQDGAEVVGYYSSDEGDGRVYGDAKNFVFFGTWTLDLEYSPTQGPIEFTISEDGLSFNGWWAFDTDPKTRNEWTGSKIGERELEEELSDVDYCLWRGAWEFDDGIFIFEQNPNESSVKGELLLLGSQSTFEGSADGWGLDIEFQGQWLSGTGHLEMDPSLDKFSGWFQYIANDERLGWSGKFVSGTIREDFSGPWMTDFGEMEITQSSNTGDVATSIENARVGEWRGRFELEGIVLGPVLSYTWKIETSDGTIDGSGELRMSEDGKSFNGQLGVNDDKYLKIKVKGLRK